ncbi:ABC transporter substrate-binding protein [Paenibacillus sp. GCM10012307]|uniref:Probable sugar-binding periplasmic protein n=1 Tax=Paenibacillus roseus TaxID=2798579 RepID=A0A934J6K6_9BACL|nr:extracellular solute-binding protein [Paenibacillus roseus]MBJ6362674.1 extracellular solute-binding protein [Paenibacillus roseus]
MVIKRSRVLLLALLTVLLAGCSANLQKEPNSKQADEPIEIKMLSSWSTDTERGRALHLLVNKYNEARAGKVKISIDINPDWPNYQEKVKTMIAAKQPPDLFNYNFNPNDLSRQNSGQLLDFSPYMDEQWRSRFKPEDIEALTFNGELTSIPYEKAGVLFYYNKKLFAEAGIQTFPQTWDEFFAACAKLKKKGIIPISLMTADDSWHSTNALTYLAAAADGMDVFKAGVSLDTPGMVAAAEKLKQLFSYSTDDAIGANYSISSNHFALGNTAMIIDGPWLIGSLDDELQKNIGISAGPLVHQGHAQKGFIVTDTYTPWSAGKQASKEKEQAIVDFMKYMTSDDGVRLMTLEGRILLSAELSLSEEELKKAGPVLSQFIDVSGSAPESIIQISRVLKPAAISKLPSLIEGMMFEQYDPAGMVRRMNEANQ